jgi:hypothetical protein
MKKHFSRCLSAPKWKISSKCEFICFILLRVTILLSGFYHFAIISQLCEDNDCMFQEFGSEHSRDYLEHRLQMLVHSGILAIEDNAKSVYVLDFFEFGSHICDMMAVPAFRVYKPRSIDRRNSP